MAFSPKPSWDRNSPRRPGALGRLIVRSPDRRYEIRAQSLFLVPSSAVVNAATADMRSSTLFRPVRGLRLVEAAGPSFYHFLVQKRYYLRVGDAITTPRSESRNCRHIIHTNVPRWAESRLTQSTAALRKQQLVDCYRRCLEEAQRVGAGSVAFPCLGADNISGWDRRNSARIGVNTVLAWFRHPVKGEERRRRIPGPIYFLCDPSSPNLKGNQLRQSHGMGVEVDIDAGVGADFAGLPHPPYVSPALELGQENIDSPTSSIEQDDAQGEVEGGDTEERSRR
ncbi:uncharacterized protein L3040_001375 [Drepanopeziza brunnea f. sp. 'multigermtubi']|uniref:uncharacterized protein n=1 Tax=Drepanopeziza brunnea f. sp. 'multigermtubi' TaxID=698441 RepID=UPI0023834C2D|nr:hypothetical protein L3040_001375 [Drepanopeziza brunnea f. sp. 'multigermtubi']